MRAQTPSRGAADLASEGRAKIRRERSKLMRLRQPGEFLPGDRFVQGQIAALDMLNDFLKGWSRRARAKKGGLGKEIKRKGVTQPPDKLPWEGRK